MKVDRKKLLKDLEQVMPGVVTGIVLYEGSDHFYFNNKTVSTFSGYVSVRLELQENIGIIGTLPAVEFYTLLKKIPGESVEIITTNSICKIQYRNTAGGTGIVEMPMTPTKKVFEYLEELSNKVDGNSCPLPSNFQEVIRLLIFPKGMHGFPGLILHDNHIWSMNGYMIGRTMLSSDIVDMWIGITEAKAISNMTGITEYEVVDDWLFLHAPDMTYMVKLKNFEQCNIAGLKKCWIRSNPENGFFEIPDFAGVKDVFERAIIFSTKNKNKELYINMEANGETLRVYTEKSYGSFSEEIPYITDVPFHFKVQDIILKDILQKANGLLICGQSDNALLQYYSNQFTIIAVAMKIGDYSIDRVGANG